MPYIKKIEIRGFKSFGSQKVTITLDKGFTVITGPNGSGKTNIVDAILFALGELSVRRLRADSASKLIFHGSPEAGIERARSAKVVIQFDNSDGRIPVDTATVTVSREVRRDGQSIYRLNGRRVSRTQILEMLSMSGITSSGHNLIMQGTITRLTDISSVERRKIIEDLIGIAQYDAEKAEAEEKLRAADLAIRTAMGRIDEVQKRVDDLERERNELLRYRFLRNEIKRLEIKKLSYEIFQLQKESQTLSAQVERVEKKVEKLRQLREKFRSKRRAVELEWRKLSSEMVEEGGARVLQVQMKIGELKSKLSELTSKINTATISLEGLRKVRDNHRQHFEQLRNEIKENRLKIRKLRRRYAALQKEISMKQAEHEALMKETAQLWEHLDENSSKTRELEQQIDKLYQRLVELRTESARLQNSIKTRKRRLTDLSSRKQRFAETLEELQKSVKDLEEIQKEQKNRLKSLEQTLARKRAQKEAIEREISEAEKIAESAKSAVVEFATQKELAETIAAEEKALRNIEELGELGVIRGVHGRFKKLIRMDRRYRRALETAAAGWLDAVVVDDLDVAYTCTETLRRLKLGRIKIIPLKGITRARIVKPPRGRGIIGIASAFVKCSRQYLPAVSFIFGDTVIVSDEKTASSVCNEGYRAVTVNGDVFEPGGGLESGYYRAPIDFSNIIPSENALKSLDEAVKALKQHLAKRNSDIAVIEEEIDKTLVEIARLSEAITTLDNEIQRVQRTAKRTRRNIRRVVLYMQRLNSLLEKEKTQLGLNKAEKNSIRKQIRKLQKELRELRRKTDPAEIQKMEIQRERLGEEIIRLRQNLGSLETEISTLQSQFENVLRISYQNSKIQLRKVEQQLRRLEKEVQQALQQKETLRQELMELEKSRIELSRTVLGAREEAKKFTAQIDDMDKRLQRLDVEYEQTDRLLNQLRLKLQTSLLKIGQHRNTLRQLGCDEPVPVSRKEVEEAEVLMQMLNMELERIGGVNQLALSHYAEQISRYKELSMRMNELEREKQAILKFMEEIDRKKREVFMEAFTKINMNLQRYFAKLTGGGKAYLKLQNPEDPFAGGVDMIVQFVNKSEILVTGASGGERSVSAVAFLFAIQEFSPASFYILDEIDAHLDAFHVSKLGELLAEESSKSQFIVITLKPEMVNKAQKVYGVYARNGVSNVISAKFLEVTA
ncbi:chromosome segregation protein SMC [Candidatus Bathyarchaeota archaeon]|nr:MAG: chromosome segregation protein SMC [Candidatus Bathyarchaeota archaeon]